MKVLIGFVLILSLGCKEKKETVVIEKIVPTVSTAEARFFLNKSDLDQKFLLQIRATNLGQYPDINYLKPQIVKFEKKGGSIALVNVGNEFHFSQIKGSKLIQSFPIVSESTDKVEISVEKGFTSLDIEEQLNIYIRGYTEKQFEKKKAGASDLFQIKESQLEVVKQDQRRFQFRQNSRIVKSKIVPPSDAIFDDSASKSPQLEQSELNVHFEIQMTPYQQNSKFTVRQWLADLNAGFFVVFDQQQQQDEAVPLTTRWDLSKESPKITVRLQNNIPSSFRKTIEEGVVYWNRVIGHNMLVIGKDFLSDDFQEDRSVYIYWLDWKSAGFARAGFETDPKSGEILRAHVIMTSSWVNKAQSDAVKNGLRLQTLCSGFAPALSHLNLITNAEQKELMTHDTVRMVIAHEMGHVLGLRHNFTGTAAKDASDEVVSEARKKYLRGESDFGTASPSSTVMDYTDSVDTAFMGRLLKTETLSYDVAVLAWSQSGETSNLKYLGYCSDEHLLLPQKIASKQTYQCSQGDRLTNVLKGNLEVLQSSIDHAVRISLMSLLSTLNRKQSHYTKSMTRQEIVDSKLFESHDFTALNSLKNYLLQDGTVGFLSLDKVFTDLIAVGDPSNSLKSTDPKFDSLIGTHASDLGGYAGIFSSFIAQHNLRNKQTYRMQVERFFSDTESTLFKTLHSELSADEVAIVKKNLMKSATDADLIFFNTWARGFPLFEKPASSTVVVTGGDGVRRMRSEKALGSPEVLVKTAMSEYLEILQGGQAAYGAQKINAKLGEVDFEFVFSSIGFALMEPAREFFSIKNYPENSIDSKDRELFQTSIAEISLALKNKSLTVLRALGKEVPATAKASDIQAALKEPDISKALMYTMLPHFLNQELIELQNFEKMLEEK